MVSTTADGVTLGAQEAAPQGPSHSPLMAAQTPVADASGAASTQTTKVTRINAVRNPLRIGSRIITRTVSSAIPDVFQGPNSRSGMDEFGDREGSVVDAEEPALVGGEAQREAGQGPPRVGRLGTVRGQPQHVPVQCDRLLRGRRGSGLIARRRGVLVVRRGLAQRPPRLVGLRDQELDLRPRGAPRTLSEEGPALADYFAELIAALATGKVRVPTEVEEPNERALPPRARGVFLPALPEQVVPVD